MVNFETFEHLRLLGTESYLTENYEASQVIRNLDKLDRVTPLQESAICMHMNLGIYAKLIPLSAKHGLFIEPLNDLLRASGVHFSYGTVAISKSKDHTPLPRLQYDTIHAQAKKMNAKRVSLVPHVWFNSKVNLPSTYLSYFISDDEWYEKFVSPLLTSIAEDMFTNGLWLDEAIQGNGTQDTAEA